MQKNNNKFFISFQIIYKLFNVLNINIFYIAEQIKILYSSSLSIVIIAAFFMGLVFSLQIVKEFLYLNAISLVGSIIATSFLRELSPVITSIILIAKIGSYFTAELATMSITEQIDILYILGINPINYLVLPRIVSFIILMPFFNCISFITSIFSCSFICLFMYDIDANIFFTSVLSALSWIDVLKSCLKTIIFAFCISLISCVWGLTASGGAKGVGMSTTSSVVISVILVIILDFFLSYYLFNNLDNLFKCR
uniref:ABC transporter permease n=1 Tax=Taenioma perpusillum TaxID=210852 RepID=A0A1Z1MQT4_9FLOR|nr:hypothetical protein [Taenioma perpusillum]ARW68438.1 hypothetical protein [Taenioma perpusillum]